MIYFISFLFGLIFGSFISVLIWRIKNNKSGIFFGRSECPNCLHILGVKDLFPIFSYIFLKGKCSYCGTKISVIYPILELTTGLFFMLSTYLIVGFSNIQFFFYNIEYVLYAWLISILIVAIIFYDILFMEISFILASILALLLIIPQLLGVIGDINNAIILALVGFSIFVGISYLWLKLRKVEGMGGGDAIGAALIGLLTPILVDLLGLNSYNVALVYYVIIMLGFILAGFFSIPAYFLTKNKKLAIPFLPFMFLSPVLFIFFGKYILDFISF